MGYEKDWFALLMDRYVLLAILVMWFGFTGIWSIVSEISSMVNHTEPLTMRQIAVIQWKFITFKTHEKDTISVR